MVVQVRKYRFIYPSSMHSTLLTSRASSFQYTNEHRDKMHVRHNKWLLQCQELEPEQYWLQESRVMHGKNQRWAMPEQGGFRHQIN